MAGTPRTSAGAEPVADGRASTGADGNGWRGPERICPGLGPLPEAGNGLAVGATGRPGAITMDGGVTCGALGAALCGALGAAECGALGGAACDAMEGAACGIAGGAACSTTDGMTGGIVATGAGVGAGAGLPPTGGTMGRPANGGRIGAACEGCVSK